jgi:hypothetical protein
MSGTRRSFTDLLQRFIDLLRGRDGGRLVALPARGKRVVSPSKARARRMNRPPRASEIPVAIVRTPAPLTGIVVDARHRFPASLESPLTPDAAEG